MTIRSSSPGLTCRRNFAFSTVARTKSEDPPPSGAIMRTPAPPHWAMVSMRMTPGTTGYCGKWPGKKNSVSREAPVSDDLVLVGFFYPVHEKERLSMREEGFHVRHVVQSSTAPADCKAGLMETMGIWL